MAPLFDRYVQEGRGSELVPCPHKATREWILMSERRVAVKWKTDLRRIVRCATSMQDLYRACKGLPHALGYETKEVCDRIGWPLQPCHH